MSRLLVFHTPSISDAVMLNPFSGVFVPPDGRAIGTSVETVGYLSVGPIEKILWFLRPQSA